MSRPIVDLTNTLSVMTFRKNIYFVIEMHHVRIKDINLHPSIINQLFNFVIYSQ